MKSASRAPVRVHHAFGLEHRQIRHRRDGNHCLEQVGIQHVGLQRGISAIRPAEYRQLRRIGHALRHEPQASIAHITDGGFPAPDTVIRVPRGAITRGTAEVRLQDREATLREVLRQPVEAPLIARSGSAMRQHNGRQVLRVGHTGRQRQIRNHRAVCGRVRDGLDRRQRLALEPGRHSRDCRKGFLVPVIDVPGAGVDIAAGMH